METLKGRSRNPMRLLIALIYILFCLPGITSSASDHRYNSGDEIPLYANKIGPVHNPSETYRYYDLPFCTEGKVEKKESLGEVLNGDRLVTASFYKLEFRLDKETEVACTKHLSKEDVAQFRSAVAKDYYFQMYYDDLPVLGFLGKGYPSDAKYYLFNHLSFNVSYNNDRVIEINVKSKAVIDITHDKEIDVEFTYSVSWHQSETAFENRLDKYFQSSPQIQQFHWFSIINSCGTLLLFAGFLAIILMRILKNGFVKYAQEQTGWKCLHGDVFRYPNHKSFLAAALGAGTQLFILTTLILILALFGVFYPYNRGALFTAVVVIYALTSGTAGYTAASFYCQLEGTHWVRNLLLTGTLFCGPLFLTFCFLNTVAVAYNVTAALPIGTITVVFLIWALVAAPLLILGGVAGKNSAAEFRAPCRTTNCPREIPSRRWYRKTVPQMAVAGLLPFSAIFVELYFLFGSVWGIKVYTYYSVLFVMFVVLVIMTALMTATLTYCQLAAEDYDWWWRSFVCGGSMGVVLYGYAWYYYYARSDMSGLMQLSFYFGYMGCVSFGLFLMLGAVGFRASLLFVRLIYRSACE